MIRHLHKALYYIINRRRCARNASYERSCFWRIATQAHQKNRSCSSNTPHLMGHDPGRPVKTHGPPHGPGGAAHIEPTSHGPRHGPAHQVFRGWAAAGPNPSHFQIFHGLARPGPSIFQQSRPGRPGPSQFSDRPGPAQPRQAAHDKP